SGTVGCSTRTSVLDAPAAAVLDAPAARRGAAAELVLDAPAVLDARAAAELRSTRGPVPQTWDRLIRLFKFHGGPVVHEDLDNHAAPKPVVVFRADGDSVGQI